MRSFAKKSKAGLQNASQHASKPQRPFFDQNHTPDPFFRKQPETRNADRRDSEMGDKNLRRLDFSEVTRPPSTARLRVPSSDELKGMLSPGSSVNKAVVLSRVRKLLERMYREGRLYSLTCNAESDPDTNIDTLMQAIFPSPGYLYQAAFERYIGPGERKMVYNSVREAQTTPYDKHRENLKKGLEAAASTAAMAANDQAGLEAVFGGDKRPVITQVNSWQPSIGEEKYAATARQNYMIIQSRLNELAGKIDTNITIDYNLDAEEMNLSGSANYAKQTMHLKSRIVANPLADVSKATLIHEAAHLANSDIIDHVYYANPGFDSAKNETKINNAAHYEELPRRIWGASFYKDKTFTPGTSKSLTTEETIRAKAVNYYRMAWDAAVDVQNLLKRIHLEQLGRKGTGKDWRFDANLVRLLEVSLLMDLTLHEQGTPWPEITLLDITTSESIVRAMAIAKSKVRKLPNVMPTGPFLSTADEIAAGVSLAVDAAMAAYGGLLGDAKRDRKLVDWLHDHYEKV